jgi:DNA replication protein DnaC
MGVKEVLERIEGLRAARVDQTQTGPLTTAGRLLEKLANRSVSAEASVEPAHERHAREARISDLLAQARIPARHAKALRPDMRWPDNIESRVWDSVMDGGTVGLVSSFGRGKTQLAAWCIDRWIRETQRTALYMRWHDYMTQMRKSWSDEESDPRAKAKAVSLLVVDELQVQQGAQTDATEFHSLIDSRYSNMRPTLIIANMSLADFCSPEGVVGPRVVSRMREGGRLIEMPGEDRRVTRKDTP